MVQGLAFLSKKSWHTKNIANQEKVWIAQQREEQEKTKTAELARQIQQEREQDELDKIAGNERRLDRGIDWMYSGQHKVATEEEQAKEAEEYLMGKEVVDGAAKKSDLDVGRDHEGVNAVLEAASSSAHAAAASAANAGASASANPGGIPNSGLAAEPSVAERNEAFRKRYEDPMFVVGMAAREKKVQAVHKKELYEKVMGGGGAGGAIVRSADNNDNEKESSRKRRKKEKIHHKKHKKSRDDDDHSGDDKRKRRRHRHRSRSRSPDSQEEDKHATSSRSRKRDRRSRSRSRDRDIATGSSSRRHRSVEEDDGRDGRRHQDRYDDRRERGRSRSRDRDQDTYRRRDRDDQNAYHRRDRDEDHARSERSYHGGDRHSEPERKLDERKRPPNYDRYDQGRQHTSVHNHEQHHHQHQRHQQQPHQNHHQQHKDHDVDDSSKRKKPGFGLQGPTSSSSGTSSSIRIQPGDLGPNQELLRKKREERDAERRRIKEASSSRRRMTPEERAAAVRAMETDAQQRDVARERLPHRDDPGGQNTSSSSRTSADRAGASFLHEMTQQTHGVRDGNMSMSARLAQNRHTNQKSHDSFL